MEKLFLAVLRQKEFQFNQKQTVRKIMSTELNVRVENILFNYSMNNVVFKLFVKPFPGLVKYLNFCYILSHFKLFARNWNLISTTKILWKKLLISTESCKNKTVIEACKIFVLLHCFLVICT